MVEEGGMSLLQLGWTQRKSFLNPFPAPLFQSISISIG
jgi:hypothetical protein